MKKLIYPTISILSLLTLNSCASLSLQNLERMFSFDNSEDPYENDPVAKAALAMRDPMTRWDPVASSASTALSSNENEDTISWQRSAPTRASNNPKQLSLGMEMEDVRSLWGQPTEVEIAGDRTGGNQRWLYYSGLSSPWGLGSARIVYFEGGRVAGWETTR